MLCSEQEPMHRCMNCCTPSYCCTLLIRCIVQELLHPFDKVCGPSYVHFYGIAIQTTQWHVHNITVYNW